MSNATKALIACLVLVGLWIGLQQVRQPRPKLKSTPACDTAVGGG